VTGDLPTRYRVLTRLQASLIIGTILAAGTVIVWLGNQWIEAYLDRIAALQRSNPQAALAAMATHLKILAVIQILPLAAFSVFMIWYCRRVIETRSLPPTGAWIIEGQRIRTGAGAVRNARILLALTCLVTVIGALAAVYVYYVATSLQPHLTGS
jgi:hypothetical protein